MYTYGELLDDVSYLGRIGAETGAIGKSVYGRIIPYVRVGTGNVKALVTAGIHAREHVSTLFAVKQIYKLFGENSGCEIYFVPMVNPDGNVLISEGAAAFGSDGDLLVRLNGGSEDFSLWKANAAEVDLNVNFDAEWGGGAQNVTQAGPENYIGTAPFSEPETRALAEFTRAVMPDITLSYHAKGREIYWDFGQSGEARERDRSIAEYASRLTGYTCIEGTRGSAGGYKDWCVRKLGIPSLTVELVSDALSHPLPDGAISEDFEREPLLPAKLCRFMAQNGYA